MPQGPIKNLYVLNPIASFHAANKAYVDDVFSGTSPQLPEAPDDANTYGVHAKTWTQVVTQAAFDAKFPQTAGMSQVANIAGTNSLTYVMQGIDLILTPDDTQAIVIVNGTLHNSAANQETDAVLCYGAGTPPSIGGAQTGTILTQPARFESTSSAGGGSFAPFGLAAVVTGLTPGTAYWFDLAVKVSGGNGSVTEINIVAHTIA